MGDGQATLRINHNTEDDLAGYRFYRSTASGNGYVLAADLPLAAVHPDAPAVTLTDFSRDGTWHFTVSAYDTSNNESSVGNPYGTKDIVRTALRLGRTLP